MSADQGKKDNPGKPPASDPARVEINLELEPGTDLEVTLIARKETGQPLATRVIKFKNPQLAAEATNLPSKIEEAVDLPSEGSGKERQSSRIAEKWKKGWIAFKNWGSQVGRSWGRRSTFWLFAGAVLIYLITRLIALDSFPIYFFTDEAVQTILAQDFLRDNFTSYNHEFLPTYFVNGSQYNLSTSVYLQVLPLAIFGKSIFITRATSVLITVIAAMAVGLTMLKIFRSRFPWLVILLLSITPAWFLHSRTAFETALATTFYAAFIYCYLVYRTQNPRYIYAAVVAGALCFYSYSPAQMVMLVSAVLLIISDIKYHRENWKLILKAFGVAILLALPYVRFLAAHGSENYRHLIILQSYWLSDKSLVQKLGVFGTEYLQGLNPIYWFLPNRVDIVRHLMKGYGHFLLVTLPFFLAGIVQCVRFFRKSEYRAMLIFFLAAPAGAALVELGVTRALFMVIPAALLTAIGFELVLAWLERHRVSHNALAGGLFAGLAIFNFYILRDAVINGPVWYNDYGLGGMQYGGKELFGETRQFLKENPRTFMVITPSWANGADILARFFHDDPQPFQLGSIDGYIDQKRTITPNTVFVVTPEELVRLKDTGKFTNLRILKTMPYPNGKPGFYFIKIDYVPNIDDIFKAEKASRLSYNETTMNLEDGTPLRIRYSALDMGPIQNAFDGNEGTLIRSEQANPLRMQLFFNEPKDIRTIAVRVGGTPTEVTAEVYLPGANNPLIFKSEKPETPDPRDVVIDFGRLLKTSRVDISTRSVRDGEPAHVHIWDVRFGQAEAE
jgi:hypothetical protein